MTSQNKRNYKTKFIHSFVNFSITSSEVIKISSREPELKYDDENGD
jgi:hypothetical protein